MQLNAIKEGENEVISSDAGLSCAANITELYEKYLSLHVSHLPKHFTDEINGFVKQNAIDVQGYNGQVQCICLMCLKGFILDKSRELGINEDSVKPLLDKFRCNLGHAGFYYNQGDLKAVNALIM